MKPGVDAWLLLYPQRFLFPPSSNTEEGGGVNTGLTVTAKWETFAVLVCARLTG